jgi:hypothetical protein
MKSFTQYVTEKRKMNEESALQKEYQEFFDALLNKYNVKSPAELSDDKKSEFFDEIKKHYTTGKGVKDSGKKIVDEFGK